MAVIYYAEGEHDAGFVGFRVATTIGLDSDYRQAYFSLNQYSYFNAHRLAHQQDNKWRLEAAQVKLESMTTKRRKNAGPHIISQGLRAKIGVERKMRGGELRAYFTPCFSVKVPGYGKGEVVFRITSLGYIEAYERAVGLYCEIHNLTDTQYCELLD